MLIAPRPSARSPLFSRSRTCDCASPTLPRRKLTVRRQRGTHVTWVNTMRIETNRSTALREEIEALRHLTVGQLKDKYRDVFGEASRSNHKQFLFRRIAWRMQANAYGGLSERARRRALEIANDADLRIGAPKTTF